MTISDAKQQIGKMKNVSIALKNTWGELFLYSFLFLGLLLAFTYVLLLEFHAQSYFKSPSLSLFHLKMQLLSVHWQKGGVFINKLILASK